MQDMEFNDLQGRDDEGGERYNQGYGENRGRGEIREGEGEIR